MAQKFIVLTNGQLAEREAATTSTGAADAGKIPALAGDGRLPESMMPVGIGADITAPGARVRATGSEGIQIVGDSE